MSLSHRSQGCKKWAIDKLYRRYKKSADNRRKVWSISESEFRSLILGACYYCGILAGNTEYRYTKKSEYFQYNGVDRVDNSIGYVKGNVVSCCGMCNMMKGQKTAESFREHCKVIAKSIPISDVEIKIAFFERETKNIRKILAEKDKRIEELLSVMNS